MNTNNITLPTFYRCPICGNIIEMIEISGMIPVCCGRQMEVLTPGMKDGAIEKHLPEFSVEDGVVIVNVGASPHPMLEEHHIDWVELVTDKGIQRKSLYPKRNPVATFYVGKMEQIQAVYAYCNLHSLWVSTKSNHSN